MSLGDEKQSRKYHPIYLNLLLGYSIVAESSRMPHTHRYSMMPITVSQLLFHKMKTTYLNSPLSSLADDYSNCCCQRIPNSPLHYSTICFVGQSLSCRVAVQPPPPFVHNTSPQGGSVFTVPKIANATIVRHKNIYLPFYLWTCTVSAFNSHWLFVFYNFSTLQMSFSP